MVRGKQIIDEKQKVVFVKVYSMHSFPDIQEIIVFLGK